jgi:hypothetical protein
MIACRGVRADQVDPEPLARPPSSFNMPKTSKFNYRLGADEMLSQLRYKSCSRGGSHHDRTRLDVVEAEVDGAGGNDGKGVRRPKNKNKKKKKKKKKMRMRMKMKKKSRKVEHRTLLRRVVIINTRATSARHSFGKRGSNAHIRATVCLRICGRFWERERERERELGAKEER